MRSYQTILVLSPKVIDEKIISPLRDSSRYKLNQWRNLIAQAVGFSTYHGMLKSENILFDSTSIFSLLNDSAKLELEITMEDLCTWYVPGSPRGYLCAGYHKASNTFDSNLYYDDGRGLWASGYQFFRLGNICMSKPEAEGFFAVLNGQILESDFESDFESIVMSTLENFKYEERSDPYYFWVHNSHEEREQFLNCSSIQQLYCKVADFYGADSEEYFASWGFTIDDFVNELLHDENLAFNL